MTETFDVVHDPLRDSDQRADAFMNALGKQPFPVQGEIIKAVVKSLKTGNKAVYIVAEMGSGKSIMGIAASLLLKKNPRVLIMCPPHLVRKWIKEIRDTVPDAKTVNLNGRNCLGILEKLRYVPKNKEPEFYVIGREKAKTHFRWRPAVIQKGSLSYCPSCGKILLDEDTKPLPLFDRNSQGKFKKKWFCTNRVRSGNNEMKDCGEQLWQPVKDERKYMPALFISKKLKGFFDMLIADELHQYKNLSGQGYAFGVLSKSCRYTLGLTGTLLGGYSSDLFHLLWKTHPHLMAEDGNIYRNPTSFISRYGILEKVTVIPEEDGLTVKSKKHTVTREKPGISPLIMGKMLLSQSVFLRLSDMAENLPEYTEYVTEPDMAELQAEAYEDFQRILKEALKEAMDRKDYSLLGGYLNALLSYPERIFQGVDVYHPRTGDLVASGPKVEGIMPKEKELLEIIGNEHQHGRKVLVYIQNSDTTDISPRLSELMTEKGYRVKVLRSGNTEGRSEQIDLWVRQGLDVLICNPRLVETGLDLLDFPTVVFYQCGYSIYSLRQASRRSWRISQRKPVRVYFMVYLKTLQEKAMKLIAAKLETSLAVEGELTDKGLSALSESSDSMSRELARVLLDKMDESGSLKDMWAAYRRKEQMVNPVLPVHHESVIPQMQNNPMQYQLFQQYC